MSMKPEAPKPNRLGIDLTITIGFPPEVKGALAGIASALTQLVQVGVFIMANFDKLEAALKRNGDAEEAVLSLLNTVVSDLRKFDGIDSKLDGYTTTLEDRAASLASAVVAGTPAAPATTEAPAAPTETPAA
jgi:hypothetical protein